MKLRQPVVECDICALQQIDNGDPTEILGLTVARAFYAGAAGGGPVPRNTFICIECLDGNDEHGPIMMDMLVELAFHDSSRGPIDLAKAFAPKS